MTLIERVDSFFVKHLSQKIDINLFVEISLNRKVVSKQLNGASQILMGVLGLVLTPTPERFVLIAQLQENKAHYGRISMV